MHIILYIYNVYVHHDILVQRTIWIILIVIVQDNSITLLWFTTTLCIHIYYIIISDYYYLVHYRHEQTWVTAILLPNLHNIIMWTIQASSQCTHIIIIILCARKLYSTKHLNGNWKTKSRYRSEIIN